MGMKRWPGYFAVLAECIRQTKRMNYNLFEIHSVESHLNSRRQSSEESRTVRLHIFSKNLRLIKTSKLESKIVIPPT